MKRLALILVSLPAVASAFELTLPIDCTLGETCQIQQFVDRDPGPGARDYACGTLSYDGHKGTDFGLPTLADMRAGVNVLAAAPGVVAGVRDGMPDIAYTEANAADVEGRECGNGVLLRHEDGFETQYCHMKSGSITVSTGETVDRGQVLGQVGLSGQTQFPHVHLSVRRNGEVVDPFDTETSEGCEVDGHSLWADTPPYRAGGLLMAGFAESVPDYAAIRDGTAATSRITPGAGGLVLFGFAFGGQADDIIELVIIGPDGPFLSQTAELEKNQAQFFRAAGKRLTADRWPAGTYTGTIRMMRRGEELGRLTTTATVD